MLEEGLYIAALQPLATLIMHGWTAFVTMWPPLKEGPHAAAAEAEAADQALGGLAAIRLQEGRAHIIDEATLQPLILLLKEGSAGAKERAAHELAHLSSTSEQLRTVIVTAGALPPLVTLLKEGTSGSMASAARTLANLAESSEERSTHIYNAGALQPLVSLLEKGSEGARTHAAFALGNLAASSKWGKVLRRSAVGSGSASALETSRAAAAADAAAAELLAMEETSKVCALLSPRFTSMLLCQPRRLPQAREAEARAKKAAKRKV